MHFSPLVLVPVTGRLAWTSWQCEPQMCLLTNVYWKSMFISILYVPIWWDACNQDMQIYVFIYFYILNICSVQSVSCVRLFATPWTAVYQASLSVTNSWSLLKLMSINLVMLFNHLILWCPLLLLPLIFPSIRVFSNESVLCIRWPKYCSFSFSISPSNEHSELISFRIDLILQSKGLSGVFSNTIIQKHQFFGAQLPLWSNMLHVNNQANLCVYILYIAYIVCI